jgi:LysM repeat protein
LALLLAAGCAAVPAGRSGSRPGRVYEPGPAFEDQTVALLGLGLFLSEPLLTPGLADPEAWLLQAAGSRLMAAREPLSAGNILKTAFSQVGRPYKFGGASPETGFDCSGFVGWVYGRNGIKLPRSSPEMINQGQTVTPHELAPGDLVFFGRKKRVTHVGIYTGYNRYIHSPDRGRIIQESSLYDRARGEYYLGARRILPDAALAPAAGAAGQLEIFQSAKPEIPAKTPKTPARTHKVKAGDTLYDLARKYGLSQAELARANQLNPRQQASLRLGQILKVPAKTMKK